MHTFNSIDSVYFVYSLSDKTKRMAYKKTKGINDTLEVKSNLLRHTDGRMYVGTKNSLRAINPDETYTTMANIGSFNLGFITTPIVIDPGWWFYLIGGSYSQHTGKKVYELKDHLGNVRAVITDRKFTTPVKDIFMAELVTASDYYAFGAPLYGRKYTSQAGSYRFGFNGQEKTDDISGEGNSYNFGDRMYDPRLGRWLSTDPMMAYNVGWNPYNFALNSPTSIVDNGGDFNCIYIYIQRDYVYNGVKYHLSDAEIEQIKESYQQSFNRMFVKYEGNKIYLNKFFDIIFTDEGPMESEFLDATDIVTLISTGQFARKFTGSDQYYIDSYGYGGHTFRGLPPIAYLNDESFNYLDMIGYFAIHELFHSFWNVNNPPGTAVGDDVGHDYRDPDDPSKKGINILNSGKHYSEFPKGLPSTWKNEKYFQANIGLFIELNISKYTDLFEKYFSSILTQKKRPHDNANTRKKNQKKTDKPTKKKKKKSGNGGPPSY